MPEPMPKPSMMEQPDPGKRHGHAVLIAGFNHLVIPYGAAWLGDILYAAFMCPLDIVPKGEEGIGTQSHILHPIQPGPLFLPGKHRGASP